MSPRQMMGCLLALMMLAAVMTEARYLPTRGQEDKLLRLRQLLKDLLENDIEPLVDHPMTGYDPRIYKREAPAFGQPLHYFN